MQVIKRVSLLVLSLLLMVSMMAACSIPAWPARCVAISNVAAG